VDVLVSEGRGLNFRLKVAAGLKRVEKTLALPEEAVNVGLEVVKFLAAMVLFAINGLILLMLE